MKNWLIFGAIAIIFVIDLFVADPLPLIDEIILGIGTVVAGVNAWKNIL